MRIDEQGSYSRIPADTPDSSIEFGVRRVKLQSAELVVAASALLLCAIGAWTVSQVEWNPSYRLVLPFVFLGLVLFLGFLYGRAIGILGSVISVAVFAFALFQPVGSLAVRDSAARSALAWALLIGVSASFLFLPDHHEQHRN